MPIEARIDLHGMTQSEAHRVLTGFITGQQAAGRRCVLVITGKGRGKQGAGILRESVPRWLNEGPLRERVLAFDYARPQDGGEGALYVLLRRKRRHAG
jgi:DNA-nicking Smr family endonuclease